MSKKKILITGANGFLGSNLTKFLSLYSDYKVYAMVRPQGVVNFLHEFQEGENPGEKRFEIIEVDLSDNISIERALVGMDIVIHLAGMVTDWGKEEDFYKLTVEGTNRVLIGAEKAGVKKVIFLSSLTVHSMNGHRYSDESAPRDMNTYPYGVTKKIGEDLVLDWAVRNENAQSAIVRPGFIIYGPYDKNSFINVIDLIKNGKFCFIDHGKRLVSYVYVENLCFGIKKLVDALKIEGAYNILDGNMSWKEWVKEWADAINVRVPKLSVSYWFILPIAAMLEGLFKVISSKQAPILTYYRIRIMYKDLAFIGKRIKREIGYEPPVSLEESIKTTIEFYSKSRNE